MNKWDIRIKRFDLVADLLQNLVIDFPKIVILVKSFGILQTVSNFSLVHKLAACLLLTATKLYCMDLQSSILLHFGNVYT